MEILPQIHVALDDAPLFKNPLAISAYLFLTQPLKNL